MDFSKVKNTLVQIFFDVLIFFSSFTISFYLRGQLDIAGLESLPQEYSAYFLRYVGIILAVKLIIFFIFRIYRKIWKYASLRDFVDIVAALALSTIVMVFIFYILQTRVLPYFPRSILIIDFLLTLILVIASRFSARIFSELIFGSIYSRKKRTLILGAGDAGEMIVREMIRQKKSEYVPVGFLDDDRSKIGRQIHGIRVYGKTDELGKYIKKLAINEVIIAIPSASGEVRKNIAFVAKEAGVVCKTLPSLYEIIDGKAHLYQVRDIQIEDILGRKPVSLKYTELLGQFSDKSILISGAGGSIGSELCRQIIKFKPSKLIMVDHSENDMFLIEQELSEKYDYPSAIPIVADIRDKQSMRGVFKKYKPQIIFHAAAYKHVPLMQLNPEAALQNNFIGTKMLAKMAIENEVERFVMLSTDKAVKPNSIMGVSKLLSEKYLQSLSKTRKTIFIIVRFGNVLGSRGSVVPIFQSQIESGGPVYVTHPEMNRFFMTISEASQLVIQSCAMGDGGEIFVLDMGNPINILELARNMIRLYGLNPDKDIKIVFSGVRRGEKMNEELTGSHEKLETTRIPSIFLASSGDSKDREELLNLLFNIERELLIYDYANLFKDLKKVIPEFDEKKMWSKV
ncbi:MAG: polysaccharide biosynthesis protein [Actinobacteria bacterium]|nr:polysaccharide biosynthesis protein [Actinomycetota bacterium]